jgi:hypothetical protein
MQFRGYAVNKKEAVVPPFSLVSLVSPAVPAAKIEWPFESSPGYNLGSVTPVCP